MYKMYIYHEQISNLTLGPPERYLILFICKCSKIQTNPQPGALLKAPSTVVKDVPFVPPIVYLLRRRLHHQKVVFTKGSAVCCFVYW